jgi:hypothetical protein
MKRVVWSFALLGLLVGGASIASAQTKARGLIAGGPSMASGDFETVDSAKAGLQFMAGGEIALGSSPFALRLDATYGRHEIEGEFVEKRFLFGLNVRLVYSIPLSGPVRPYVVGGGGFLAYTHSYARNNYVESDVTKGQFTYGGGGGVDVTVGPTTLFVEGRMDLGSRQTSVTPILIGLKFGSLQ